LGQVAVKVITDPSTQTKPDIDAIWNEAREAVKDEAWVVRRRLLESHFEGTEVIEQEIRRQVEDQLERTIEVPDGLTEDQAVAFVIEAYRNETGVELSEADVRIAVREQMGGRETT
jgi:hypothetical protein